MEMKPQEAMARFANFYDEMRPSFEKGVNGELINLILDQRDILQEIRGTECPIKTYGKYHAAVSTLLGLISQDADNPGFIKERLDEIGGYVQEINSMLIEDPIYTRHRRFSN